MRVPCEIENSQIADVVNLAPILSERSFKPEKHSVMEEYEVHHE